MDKNKKFKKLIIFESAQASTVELLEESVVGNQYKLKFRAKLQEADVINNNRRVYSQATLQSVYIQLKNKAQERKLVGEMDHPQPTGDNASKVKRSSTIALDRACVIFSELEWDGNAIYAICETLSNTKGMDLYALLKDGVTIGFSLRAFGETKRRSDGSEEVLASGIKALTYDVVANPSHDNSVITEFLSENTDTDIDTLMDLNESSNTGAGGSGHKKVDTLNSLIGNLQNELKSEKTRIREIQGLQKVQNKTILEENYGVTQQNSSQKMTCFNNVCSIAPLEEAIEYLVQESVKLNNTIPKIKVKSL